MAIQGNSFSYDPKTGKARNAESVSLSDGTKVAVPPGTNQQIKREEYGLDGFHPDVADATIRSWESDD